MSVSPRSVAAVKPKLAVLGAGLMGAGIAAEFLKTGYQVSITVSPSTSAAVARARVQRLVGVPTPGLRVVETTTAAAVDAGLVIESLPEELEIKHAHLREAQAAAPSAVLATNTSSLSVGRVGQGLDDPQRLIGMHFLNPPTMFRVVEVIPGPRSSASSVARGAEFVVSIGKHPLMLRRDIPGFLINRLQMALLRECVHLVDQGVASAEDIDLLMQQGLARRWTALGPFATVSLGGAGLFERIAQEVYPSLAREIAPIGGVARRQLGASEIEELRQTRLGTLGRLQEALDGTC